jgi:signal transduction histidine kinase
MMKASDYTTALDKEEFLALYEQMLGSIDINIVLRNATAAVIKTLNADRGTVYIVQGETQELRSVLIFGNVARSICVPIAETSLTGYCALSRKAFVIEDAYGDLGHIDAKLQFDQEWDRLNHYRTRDVMCVPAIFKDDVVGVIQVINGKSRPFQSADLLVLQYVARFVAYALYHVILYDEIATLKQLKKEKAQFMRIMVHELKSPIGAIHTLAETQGMLINEDPANPKVIDMNARIKHRSEMMIDLIEEILQLSRIKSGGPLSDVVIFDLTAELSNCCNNFEDQAQFKKLAFKIDIPSEPILVRMDKQGCNLILSNLVSNAVKYTQSGSVRVSIQARENQAVLKVEDTGVGIPEEDIPKMFTEFFRASNVRASEIRGTGVGLAGVKDMVERFGGILELKSKLDEGSTFIVRLPLAEPLDGIDKVA